MNQQRDLVLSINEFCFLQSKTNGMIKENSRGPLTNYYFRQEALVNPFNPRFKKFEETTNFEKVANSYLLPLLKVGM